MITEGPDFEAHVDKASGNMRSERAHGPSEQGTQAALPAGPDLASPRARSNPSRAMATSKQAAFPPAERSVQETCRNDNYLLRSLCEARECFHREHAAEPACQRVKAAEDRRRQRQEAGG